MACSLRTSPSAFLAQPSRDQKDSCLQLRNGRFPQEVAFFSRHRRFLQSCTSSCANQPFASRLHVTAGFKLDDVPHMSHWIPNLQTYPNPHLFNPAYANVDNYFIKDNDVVCQKAVVKIGASQDITVFRRSGPRAQIAFEPKDVRAAIVTCGGLCPGLNTVIRELVWCMWFRYGVRSIQGIEGGYRGFYARNLINLDPWKVQDIHKRGGTFLGTSRGGHETTKIVNSIEDRGINQLYIIGGDGTQRGAEIIYEETRRRGLKVAVAGIPKTIDNDIAVIDRSFGFDTAVEEAQRAINAAHVEAESTGRGVGLVKFMGRYCGQIAMQATLASRDVDCCLIPEVPFHLEGEGGLLDFVDRRLFENDHCVMVVAEGAGQRLMADDSGFRGDREGAGKDASGNLKLLDIGLWLSDKLKKHFSDQHKDIQLKYIDPTYMIRAIPANASDNIYCTLLAHGAIHGAMAGYSGFIVGPVNNTTCYIPIQRVTEPSIVSLTDRMWARLLSSTSQPTFMRFEDAPKATSKGKPVLATAEDSGSSSISSGGGGGGGSSSGTKVYRPAAPHHSLTGDLSAFTFAPSPYVATASTNGAFKQPALDGSMALDGLEDGVEPLNVDLGFEDDCGGADSPAYARSHAEAFAEEIQAQGEDSSPLQ